MTAFDRNTFEQPLRSVLARRVKLEIWYGTPHWYVRVPAHDTLDLNVALEVEHEVQEALDD